MSQFFDETLQGLLEPVDIEKYTKDSRLTEPSDGKIFDYRKMYELVKQLGRPLTDKEAEQFRIK